MTLLGYVRTKSIVVFGSNGSGCLPTREAIGKKPVTFSLTWTIVHDATEVGCSREVTLSDNRFDELPAVVGD